MLPLLVALPTALGPLLRACWDLWAQSVIHLAVVAGLTAWIASRILIGFIPLPSRRTLLWVGLLALLGGASTALSPVHGLARPDWHNMLEALWLFPAMAALSKDERAAVDEAVRVSGWILMVLAFYQRFALGDERPASALVNQNVYAGAVLLFLPLAVEKRDWLLAGGLLVSLWWTRSVGAWLGLAAASLILHRGHSAAWRWSASALLFACGVALYGKLGTPDTVNRWWWWKTAAAMAWDRPWTGWGPGAFAYVSPAYLSGEGQLKTLYAHHYPLQVLAEYGAPFAALWFAGLGRCVLRTAPAPHKRFGVIAALIHSLWDYPLSMPANLWLFSYFAASTIPDGPEGINVRSRHRLPAAFLAVGLGLAASAAVWKRWQGDRLCAAAATSAGSGRWEEAEYSLARAAVLTPDDPQPPQLAAALTARRLAAARPGDPLSEPGASRAAWLRAAAALERSARLNPYRAATWTELASCYRRIGMREAAEEVEREGREKARR